ncbi:hypothetical protein LQ327_22705 [Actinomycetospora endophytica]|uniref:ABC-type branched-subunit amino acid transport system substrate-binding protein n=1 Tax=Actinomycetospora endophytica TaxID=2291215 RepID=A0ABS8PD72_9PSEU|nr:hypothetical protein [Actinomycetospora endophytica]MCD2196188.1 hypothetical protein [Actinomycetospora endophytica]
MMSPTRRLGSVFGWFGKLTALGRVLVIAVVLVVVAGVVYGVWTLLTPTCGSGTSRTDDQCLGVSDGSAQVTAHEVPGYADILGKIKAQNDLVTSSKIPYVTIAYLMPVQRQDSADSAGGLQASLHELQGAFIEQLQVNSADNAPVHVRLVIANDGDSSAHWREVVPTLMKMVGSDHLVAVVATGYSVQATQDAITALSVARIPVITTRLTADTLDGVSTPDRAFARIAPSNSDEAAALAADLRTTASKVLVVRSNDSTDTYVQSLAVAFEQKYAGGAGTLMSPEETFNPGPYSFMSSVVSSVCERQPNVIMFAGRSDDLEQFVKALATRSCGNLPLTIVTGDDAEDFTAAVADEVSQETKGASPSSLGLIGGLNSGVTVRYADIADSSAWKTNPEAFVPGAIGALNENCSTCFHGQFPSSSLDDDAAIMGHDAITTVATALTFGSQLNNTTDGVTAAFKRLHGPNSIPLASGWLSLSPYGDPINKAVPILQVGSDGGPQLFKFGSPAGRPCIPDRTPC